MKKIMYAAMAALAITSCSQNEEFEAPSQKSAIGFNTVVSKTTRAAITDDAALQSSGFTVYAYNTGTLAADAAAAASDKFESFISGINLKYATEKWGYTGDTYYWPLEDNIQFYAYPTGISKLTYVAPTGTAYPGVSYEIAPVAGDQVDIVLAKKENLKKAGEVQFVFTHALTQVNFSAQGNAGFDYTITSIDIEGVSGAGTYSFGTGTWTTTGEVKDYSYPIAEAQKAISGETKKDLDLADNTLMLMPQSMAGTDVAQIKVVYEVTKDGKKVYETGTGGALISLKGTANWEAGKKMRYTLTLANGSASVTFSAGVGAWGGEAGEALPKP